MKRYLKFLAIPAATAAAICVAAIAWAYWTSTGSGSASATVATLDTPENVTASQLVPGLGVVNVDWDPVTPPGGTLDGYYVERFEGVSASPACGTSPSSLTLLTDCIDTPVPSGTFTYKVTVVFRSWTAQSDASAAVTVIIDTIGPDVEITFPATAAYNSVAWNAGCLSSICGTADDVSGVVDVEVTIQQGSGSYWSGLGFISPTPIWIPAAGTTSWSFAFPASNFLSDGTYTVSARATDGALNTGSATSTTFTIDTTAPGTPSTPDLDAASDSGSLSTDNVTSDTTPTVTGTAEAGATVTLLEGTTVVGSATATGGSYTITSSVLGDGAHAIKARATDVSGNTSADSATLTVTVDSASATPSTPDLDAASDSGSSATDDLTSDTTPTVTGIAEAGATVTLFEGATALGSGVATGGNYTITTSTLGQGAHAIKAQATDAAGNTSTDSATLTVTIDTTTVAPSTPDLDAASDSGSSATDDLTSDTTPTVTGTAEAGATVTLFDGATQVGSGIATGGNYGVTTITLSTGAHTVTAQATDLAGNASIPSGGLSVTIDTTGPTVNTITSSNNNGVVNSGDTLVVTFSENIGPSTVNTTAGAATLTFSQSGPDHVMVSIGGLMAVSDTGLVKGSWVKNSKTISYAGTLTVTASNQVTFTAGACTANCSDSAAGASGTLTFVPNPALKDSAGNAAGGTKSYTATLF